MRYHPPMSQATTNAAPGDLELVRAFVNTYEVDDDRDALSSPEGLGRWLGERGLLDPGYAPDDEDVTRAARVREALRQVLLANNGEDFDARAVDVLNEAGRRAGLVVTFDGDTNTRLEPAAAGVDRAVGRLLAIVNDSQREGTWGRLKACRNDTCQWAFYDHSRNRSGTWCTMAVCGNRMKARKYRARHAVYQG